MIASLRGLEAMKSACYLRLRDISNDLEIVDSPLFSAISARQVLELHFHARVFSCSGHPLLAHLC